jgi:hypothetical protein
MKTYAALLLIVINFLGCRANEGPTGLPNKQLNGQWLLEINSKDIGRAKFFMDFEADSSQFIAYTRKGVDREIMGFAGSTLARWFTGSFKEGSLLHIVKGKIRYSADSIILAGILTSSIGNYYFNGHILNGKLSAVLKDGAFNPRGTIAGVMYADEKPLDDYRKITNQALEIARGKLFSPSILESRKWKKFEKKITKSAVGAQDDLEMVFAFFYHKRKLGFSHFGFMKMTEEMREVMTAETSEKYLSLSEPKPGTALLTISSFAGTAREVDSFFEIINAKKYTNLIVDLRDNTGGNVEPGIRFGSYIADSTFYGGVFLTQNWFRKHNNLPTVAEYPQFPHFSEANNDLLFEGISKEEGLCLKVLPAKHPYQGKVYILANGSTASTCEPIVYGAKQYKLATIVGEKTAGAMLSSEMVDVASGFTLIVPTADYYAADGYHIDRQGVKPDIEVKSDGALEYVLKELIR